NAMGEVLKVVMGRQRRRRRDGVDIEEPVNLFQHPCDVRARRGRKFGGLLPRSEHLARQVEAVPAHTKTLANIAWASGRLAADKRESPATHTGDTADGAEGERRVGNRGLPFRPEIGGSWWRRRCTCYREEGASYDKEAGPPTSTNARDRRAPRLEF